MVSVDLVDRVKKLEKEVESLKSSQFMGGERYVSSSGELTFNTHYSSSNNRDWGVLCVGYDYGVENIITIEEIVARRSDGLELKTWGADSDGMSMIAPTGETILVENHMANGVQVKSVKFWGVSGHSYSVTCKFTGTAGARVRYEMDEDTWEYSWLEWFATD